MTHAVLFLSAFSAVFLLVFQQQNVIHRARWLGSLTSIAIGTSQVVLWRLVPDASMGQIIAVLAGGPVGYNAALSAHPWVVRWWGMRGGYIQDRQPATTCDGRNDALMHEGAHIAAKALRKRLRNKRKRP